MFGRELLAHPWFQSFAAVLFLGALSVLLAGPYDGSALGRALLVACCLVLGAVPWSLTVLSVYGTVAGRPRPVAAALWCAFVVAVIGIPTSVQVLARGAPVRWQALIVAVTVGALLVLAIAPHRRTSGEEG